MNILVKSREEANNFDCTYPWIWISMSAPEDKTADFTLFKPTLVEKLHLVFHDVDDRFKDVLKKYPSSDVGKNPIFFNDEMAKQAVNFVEKYKNTDVHTLVCQCEAGISRSSGMAAALSKCLLGHDRTYFNSMRYVPNMLVYRKIMNQWYDKE